MTRLNKFFRLSFTEQKLLIKASFLLLSIQFGLFFLPFKQQYRLLVRFSNLPASPRANDPFYLQQVVSAITKASRHLLGPNTCLPQALAAIILLRRHGFPVHLIIGVRKDEFGIFKAHAWVENEGIVVIGGYHLELESYTILPGLEDILI
jgi:hypothetical protein